MSNFGLSQNSSLASILGFMMSPDGEVWPFGKLVEDFDITDSSQSHDASFQDSISHLPNFISLNIPYDPNKHILQQASSFTHHGVVMFFNITLQDLNFLLFVPEQLTERQISSFSQLYSELCTFDNSFIYQGDSITFKTVDEFYRVFHIPFSVSKDVAGKKIN